MTNKDLQTAIDVLLEALLKRESALTTQAKEEIIYPALKKLLAIQEKRAANDKQTQS